MARNQFLYGVYERQLAAGLDRSRVPRHVGVILDGNRRWAKAFGSTAADLSVAFVSQAALDAGDDHMTTRRRRVAVKGTRNIGPANMVLNNRLGTVDVDARTGMVSLDGEAVYSAPSDEVSLSRLYFL